MVVRKPVRVLFAGSLGEAAARPPITQERSKGPSRPGLNATLYPRASWPPTASRDAYPEALFARSWPFVSASERRLEGLPAQSNGRANCRAYPPLKVRPKGPPNQLNQART